MGGTTCTLSNITAAHTVMATFKASQPDLDKNGYIEMNDFAIMAENQHFEVAFELFAEHPIS